MQSEHKAFVVFASVGIPLFMALWSVNHLIGFVFAALISLVAWNAKKQDWFELGELVDTKVLTFAVLIGGSLLIVAQTL